MISSSLFIKVTRFYLFQSVDEKGGKENGKIFLNLILSILQFLVS